MSADLQEAVAEAQTAEANTGKRHYVRKDVPDGEPEFTVTDRMPMLGEWYDSDGIRHG